MKFKDYVKAKKSELHHAEANIIFEKVIDIRNEQKLVPMIYLEGTLFDTNNIYFLFLNFDDWTVSSECINPFKDENPDLHLQDIQLC